MLWGRAGNEGARNTGHAGLNHFKPPSRERGNAGDERATTTKQSGACGFGRKGRELRRDAPVRSRIGSRGGGSGKIHSAPVSTISALVCGGVASDWVALRRPPRHK